jgi:hypothetical protein
MLFEEEIHIMQLFYANQSIRNVRDMYSWYHSNSQCIDLCFLKLNIGNKRGLCSELKKCPGIWRNSALRTALVDGNFARWLADRCNYNS